MQRRYESLCLDHFCSSLSALQKRCIMRKKNAPRRQSRPIKSAKFQSDVILNSEKTNLTWENLSKSAESLETISSQMNQTESSEIWEVLDLTMAGPSSRCYQCWTNDNSFPLDYTTTTLSQNEPIDLSMKTTRKIPIDSVPPKPAIQTKEFKDTFLYKMLTDPTFIENLKVSKNTVVFSCPYCKKQFSNQENLELHQKSLIDNNKISCCACNKTFTQKRYLRYHQRSHSEKNKFTCDICTKKYSRQDNLTRHNTYHTNPDKFPCNYCERTFSRKDLLNKHVKGHENRFRYHCDVCNKYFKGPLSLENHKKNYHKNVNKY